MNDNIVVLSQHKWSWRMTIHITNYWANWDQCTLSVILAIGV